MQIETRPSASPIWTKCALAPRLIASVPEQPESDPAREGTCAAWVAETVLRNERVDCKSMVGEAHVNGWVVDLAMAYYIQKYVNMIRERGGEIDVERRIRLNDHIQGTADAIGAFSDGVIIVDDLKYGYDIVEPYSPQLAIYAGGLLRYLTARDHRVSKVTLGIYQPRAFHPSGIYRTATFRPDDLMARVREIEAAATRAHSSAAIATPGKHCRYCRGAAVCSAVTHSLYDAHAVMLNGEQRDMTPDELRKELEFLEIAEAMLKSRKDAVHAEASARSDTGEQVPGWMIQRGYGQRRWTVGKETVKMVTGIDPSSDKMITPAQLEAKGADPELVKAMTETPRTAAKWKPVPQGYYAAAFGET
jgi:hypothetical protein